MAFKATVIETAEMAGRGIVVLCRPFAGDLKVGHDITFAKDGGPAIKKVVKAIQRGSIASKSISFMIDKKDLPSVEYLVGSTVMR